MPYRCLVQALSLAMLLPGCLLFEDVNNYPLALSTSDAGRDLTADVDSSLDVGTPDVSPADVAELTDVGPDVADLPPPCVPETDEELCMMASADCGRIEVVDQCDAQRTIECGECSTGECGAQTPNVCGCPCAIEGRCFPADFANPDNPCEVCVPAVSSTAWTVAVDAPCDDGDACTVGDRCQPDATCQPGALTDCSALDDECQVGVCDGDTGECSAEQFADQTPCTDDGVACTTDVCVAGVCEHQAPSDGCVIDGDCVEPGELNPENECQACEPSKKVDGWWHVNDGTVCGTGNPCRCERGVCEHPSGNVCGD